MSILNTIKDKINNSIKSIKNNSAQKKAANAQIYAKSKAAYYKAKEKEQIRYAQAKARHEADEGIKQLKGNDKQSSLDVFGFGGGFGGGGFNPISGQSYGGSSRSERVRVRYSKPKKRKGKKSKVRYVYRNKPSEKREERFDVLGGF